MRIRKEREFTNGTHLLETAKGGTCQEKERKRPRKGNSLSREGRGRDFSEHGKKSIEQGALTS